MSLFLQFQFMSMGNMSPYKSNVFNLAFLSVYKHENIMRIIYYNVQGHMHLYHLKTHIKRPNRDQQSRRGSIGLEHFPSCQKQGKSSSFLISKSRITCLVCASQTKLSSLFVKLFHTIQVSTSRSCESYIVVMQKPVLPRLINNLGCTIFFLLDYFFMQLY